MEGGERNKREGRKKDEEWRRRSVRVEERGQQGTEETGGQMTKREVIVNKEKDDKKGGMFRS